MTDIEGPPVDGGWSEWGPWACSVSCNGGTGIRKRRCDSPTPNIRGEPCVGPSIMTGRCNEILCGDITEGNFKNSNSIRGLWISTRYTYCHLLEPAANKFIFDLSEEISSMSINA